MLWVIPRKILELALRYLFPVLSDVILVPESAIVRVFLPSKLEKCHKSGYLGGELVYYHIAEHISIF